MEADGSVRIGWEAEGYVAIHVYARFWPRGELDRFAQVVADVALTNRTLADLRRQLRRELGGSTFEIEAPDADAPDRRVRINFHPPPGNPNPDADVPF
ncbi:MAG TPA: hypothetical protein VM305_11160 [Candidatus Limnocylindrales bacterium]|nr:hypothetical protein [Candidatus Limnocylindrales bacterium]